MTFSAKTSFVAASLLLAAAVFGAPAVDVAGPAVVQRSAPGHGVHSVPLQRIHAQHNTNLHPAVVHQQHANRANQRLAAMTKRTPPSEAELAGHLDRRIASLPAEHQKRYSTAGLLNLESLPAVQNMKAAKTASGASSAANAKASNGYSSSELTAYEYNALTPAIAPTFAHSAGLDIVANDIGYLTTISIGSPADTRQTEYRLLVDSGSSDLWVGSEYCVGTDGGSCDRHLLLGPDSSSTFHDTNQTFHINYGSGNITGHVVTDNLSFAGMNVTNHTFGVATIESPDFTSQSTLFDGILGLATPSIAAVKGPTLVQALANDGLIKDPIVSFYLDRSSNASNYGQITFGAMDPSKYQNGTATTFANPVSGYWGALVESVSATNKILKLSKRTAVLDTGTSLFVVPKADAKVLHAAIPGAKYDSNSTSWTIPCTTKTVLSLAIGGKNFTINPHDLTFLPVDPNDLTGTCVSAISVGTTPAADEWLLGDVFLKNVYFSTNVATNEVTLAQAL